MPISIDFYKKIFLYLIPIRLQFHDNGIQWNDGNMETMEFIELNYLCKHIKKII